MNYKYKLVAAAVAVVTLAGCSDGADRRRQANQDFNYLETTPLETWTIPAGAQPSQNTEYAIPAQPYSGGVGPAVDIRPPQQVLALIPGARSVKDDEGVTLLLATPEELNRVWRLVQDLIVTQNIGVRAQTANAIETDWVTWNNADEDGEIGSRYLIEKGSDSGRNTFNITLVDWREGGQSVPVTLDNKERYSILMTNLVTAKYDEQVREQARLRAQELVKQIPISMGQDRSGLPVIIARAPYDVFWERLPSLLDQFGFTVEGRNRSQGIVEVKYKPMDDEFWQEIGTKPLQFDSRAYTIQLGDLGNRTSLNVTNSDGKPVTEEALNSLAPVLSAVIDRSNQQ
ncbi:lipoprotein-34 precursor [Photobacterium aphoticum]|uniref:Outer membrane protein assembly factor BamC n=1 Tax=Photobacterium aphoticum TaxID=754436 RepID=A0A090R004_9GAMM|nr:lipoprotein-34 precursor [Photobacterium aphoticum]